ncbi:MAG: IS481 family transposase, partial [Thermoplasmata archaeon]
KHIISRINHPQTNGKVEKWFHLYEKYRKDFETFEDLVEWYNKVRYHESLDTDYYLQTPEEAFWSRLPEESKLGNFYRIMGVE